MRNVLHTYVLYLQHLNYTVKLYILSFKLAYVLKGLTLELLKISRKSMCSVLEGFIS